MAEGFNLDLHNFCSYCGDFEPNVEKIETTMLGEMAKSHITTIKCENADKCARIRENLKRGLDL